jgi:6-phosphogluconolactonase
MEPIIKIFPSVVELTGFFISRISEQITREAPGRLFSVALSGGSTPRAIFKLIAEKYGHNTDWSKAVFFWGDERCVPPSDPDSNYRMTYENLIKHLDHTDSNFFRIQGENDPEDEAISYSGKVDTMLPHSNNIPQFDLMILGLGEDGHTASIFPYNIGLFDSDKLFETSRHPVTGQIRITATGKLINNAREICFLATGQGKAAKVAQILHKKEGWKELPASLVNPADGRVIWLLDEAAASGL